MLNCSLGPGRPSPFMATTYSWMGVSTFISSSFFLFMQQLEADIEKIMERGNTPDTDTRLVGSTQQNSYSISHLLGIVTTQWQESGSVVTVDNFRQLIRVQCCCVVCVIICNTFKRGCSQIKVLGLTGSPSMEKPSITSILRLLR